MGRKIELQLDSPEAKELYRTLAAISKPQDMARFLRDLFTLKEIIEATRRFQTAKMLEEGRSIRNIAKQIKISSATVSRINYWLHHGTGGYGIGLKKIV